METRDEPSDIFNGIMAFAKDPWYFFVSRARLPSAAGSLTLCTGISYLVSKTIATVINNQRCDHGDVLATPLAL
jgi:hypothetical protein